MDLGRTDPLANPMVWKDFKKCRDVDELYNWAANHGIDVRRHCELLFSQLCYDSKPLPVLLQALEDAALGTPGNFRFLLKWQMERRRDGKRQGRLKPEDMPILQQWMNRQLHLGLKSEEDILAFLEIVSRTSDTMKCNLVASIQGLQTSWVLGFNDLGMTTQIKIIEYVIRAPVTRQMLELGFSLVVAIPYPQYKVAEVKICAFIRRVVHMHASRCEHEKRDIGSSELVSTILETIMGLPKRQWHNVVMITTKNLMDDHLRMPAIEAATMQLPSLWLAALAERRSCRYRELEDLLGTQKPEVVVPYLQRLHEREQVRFILRHWFGRRSLSGHARAQQIFDEIWSARPNESVWFNMLRTGQQSARESSRRLDSPIRRVFKTLQMLRQSETIVEIVKQYRNLRATMDETDIVYIIREHLEEQPYIAERLLHFYPGLRLEMCPELAERMILDPKTHPATALRYMRRHSPVFHVYGDRHVLERFSRPRMELLARMALAYSTAPHIPPRLAFKRVYECYTQHMKERLGPLPVATARAFTRAGLIRHLETGQYGEPTTFDWILSIIRSTEGVDVADKVFQIGYRWRGLHLTELESNKHAASLTPVAQQSVTG